jgi:hypothetical protein
MVKTFDAWLTALVNRWKGIRRREFDTHPCEEDFISLAGGKLPDDQVKVLRQHIIDCDRCGQIFAAQITLRESNKVSVPRALVDSVRDAVGPRRWAVCEIILQCKENCLELLHTTGEALAGLEGEPAAVMRNRMMKDFQDSLTVIKDVLGARIEIIFERRRPQDLEIGVSAKNKSNNRPLAPIRVTLRKGPVELESYLADTGRVVFSQVVPGKYTVLVLKRAHVLVEIALEIKV